MPVQPVNVEPLPSLSVVIPVYNEPEWIVRSVGRAASALTSSRWVDAEIVVVDDGSTDSTAEVLENLECDVPLRVIHQTNRGRLGARRVGLDHATGDYVLFLDARVLIEHGLDDLFDRIAEGMTVWNAHCHVSHDASLLTTFWDALPRIFWSDYFREPRRISFGLEDFHRYPKGMTGFFAPRSTLLEAFQQFHSGYAHERLANDDTPLIQHVARAHQIWLSPEFAVRYEPRNKLSRFVPHAYHRGIVFVDGFLRRDNPYAPVIMAFYAISAATLLAIPRRLWLAPAAYLSITASAIGLGVTRRLSSRHLLALGMVTPIFATAYGSGMWAGLILRLRSRFSE